MAALYRVHGRRTSGTLRAVHRACFAAVFAIGCATAPTTLQGARTVEEHEVRFHAGGSIPISTRFISSLSDTVDTATERAEMAETAGRPLDDDEERQLSEGSLGLILFAPAPVFELGARWSPVERFDVGFEWAGPMLRGDAKYQMLAQADVDLAVLAGYTYHTSTAPSILEDIHELFEFAAVVDYGRHDVDLAFLASSDPRQTASWYASLRYMASFASLNLDVGWGDMRTRTDTSSVMHTIAGAGGLRVGTEKLALMLELTIAYIVFEPTIEGRDVSLSGFLFMPALGLSFETG